MNLIKHECQLELENLTNLSDALACFEDFIAINFVLKTGEYFYFENNALLGSEVGYEALIDLDLKLWRAFSCIHKPLEDCIEMKNDSDYGKVRFQIWLEDMFYKYELPVPQIIEDNLKSWDRVLTYGPAKLGFE